MRDGELALAPADVCPLAVDLDGTLIKTDFLHEGLCELARRNPAGLVKLAALAPRGKAAIKRAVAEAAPLDVASMPFNDEVVAYLRRCKAEGRRIGLFTAADQSIADKVAMHLGLFEVAMGSNGSLNLSGDQKRQAIESAFGERFAYLGDSEADLPIFAHSESVALAGPVDRLRRKLPEGTSIEATFSSPPAGLRTWLKALRIKQWAKNILVFVPAILSAHPILALINQTILLFVIFGALASGTYLINDLLDLAADRAHPEKRRRPLASGAIKISHGVVASVGLLAAALTAAVLWLPPAVMLVLLGYLGLTLSYSFYIKRQPVADVLSLAGLFTSRILAGSLLIPNGISPWFLTFSVLLFLSLAQVKRYAELRRVVAEGADGIQSRGYSAADLPLLLAAGVGSALASTVIFAIYLIQEQYPRAIYSHPGFLWFMMPVLLGWLLRVWRLTLHGQMQEDPVLFALHDRVSLAIAAVVGLLLVVAWL